MVEIGCITLGQGFGTYIKFWTDESDSVAEWCSNTFIHNFVILEFAHRIIAGGAVDNKISWQERWNKDSEYSSILEYELRCDSTEATLFLLKFKENE